LSKQEEKSLKLKKNKQEEICCSFWAQFWRKTWTQTRQFKGLLFSEKFPRKLAIISLFGL